MHREDTEGIPSNIVLVLPPHVVNANEQRVIHHSKLLQHFSVTSKLLRQERMFLWIELEHLDRVEILQDCTQILSSLLFRALATDSGTLEIVRLVDIFVRREEVVHDHEVDLEAVRELNAIQTVEARQERVRIALHMLVVLLQDP